MSGYRQDTPMPYIHQFRCDRALVTALWMGISMGLLRLSRLAWIGAVGIVGLCLLVAVGEVSRGNLSGYALLTLFLVPTVIVLLSGNVIRAFWRRGLASGRTPRTSAPAELSYQVESEAGEMVEIKESWSRNDILAVLSLILAILGIISQLFTQEIKQLFGFYN